jgi:hypothetical protein
MAFVAPASAPVFPGVGKSVKGIWTNAAAQLDAASGNLGGSLRAVPLDGWQGGSGAA